MPTPISPPLAPVIAAQAWYGTAAEFHLIHGAAEVLDAEVERLREEVGRLRAAEKAGGQETVNRIAADVAALAAVVELLRAEIAGVAGAVAKMVPAAGAGAARHGGRAKGRAVKAG